MIYHGLRIGVRASWPVPAIRVPAARPFRGCCGGRPCAAKARAAVKQAEASLAALDVRKSYTRIYSPISGVVMKRFKTIGEYVDEQPVLRVAQLDPLHVEVFVPVEQLGDIRSGMRAEVWSDAVNGRAWNAEVTRVDKVADVASGTYGVRLELPNPDYKVPAGLRCQLAFKPEPVLPIAELPADESDGVAAVEGKKKPVSDEPASDVVAVVAVPFQAEDAAPSDVTELSVDEGRSEVVTVPVEEKTGVATAEQAKTASVAETTRTEGTAHVDIIAGLEIEDAEFSYDKPFISFGLENQGIGSGARAHDK